MSQTADFQIAIIGAGFAGLGMAIALREEGIESFVVLEQADDLGGTWRDNGYPGCACDIASVLYSFSADQNPSWTRAFAGQAEIWEYMRAVARRRGVLDHLLLGEELLDAAWDDRAQHWRITTTTAELTAEVLISAAGALSAPAVPQLPGLGRFAGRTFHSARWDHDRSVAGERVAVVGTGASAIQFVPEIQPQVAHLAVFQRTPPWVLKRGNPEIPEVWRRRFAAHPSLLAGARELAFSMYESMHFAFKHPAVMKLLERQARADLARQVADPRLRAALTPDYRLGCKRVLASDRWYPALGAANVDVVTAGIAEVCADGIRDRDGVLHPVDTIIFATGFHVTDMPIAERIAGRGGERLADHWGGSPQAHLGLAVNGFPNLFLLLGPNTGLGHNSVLLMIEAQIGYLRQTLRQRRAHRWATLEPTPAAQARFIAEVERGTRGSVWTAGGCLSWYLDRTGRNSTLWPGSVRAYRRRLRRFQPADYDVGFAGAAVPAPVPGLV